MRRRRRRKRAIFFSFCRRKCHHASVWLLAQNPATHPRREVRKPRRREGEKYHVRRGMEGEERRREEEAICSSAFTLTFPDWRNERIASEKSCSQESVLISF